ncbi:hypothetical protein MTO96_015561 [Rhipicephalus appendiculatus]
MSRGLEGNGENTVFALAARRRTCGRSQASKGGGGRARNSRPGRGPFQWSSRGSPPPRPRFESRSGAAPIDEADAVSARPRPGQWERPAQRARSMPGAGHGVRPPGRGRAR